MAGVVVGGIVRYCLLTLLLISPAVMADEILCTGMSNAKRICEHWIANNTTGHTIINGAIGGWDVRRIHQQNTLYWQRAINRTIAQGYAVEDIDIVWNLNATTSKNWSGNRKIERAIIRDYFIEHQVIAFVHLPNLRRGYHSPRTSGEWCAINPEPFATDIRGAIRQAVKNFSKWGKGPDLASVSYVREDFIADGCHPSDLGLLKTTAIMNDFFGDR